MSKRYGLRDDQWKRIQEWLPDRAGHVGRTARDNRLFVEAVLYRYRAGIPRRYVLGCYRHLAQLMTRPREPLRASEGAAV